MVITVMRMQFPSRAAPIRRLVRLPEPEALFIRRTYPPFNRYTFPNFGGPFTSGMIISRDIFFWRHHRTWHFLKTKTCQFVKSRMRPRPLRGFAGSSSAPTRCVRRRWKRQPTASTRPLMIASDMLRREPRLRSRAQGEITVLRSVVTRARKAPLRPPLLESGRDSSSSEIS